MADILALKNLMPEVLGDQRSIPAPEGRFLVLRRAEAEALAEEVLITLTVGLRDGSGKVPHIPIYNIDRGALRDKLLAFLNDVCPYPEIAGINDEIAGYDVSTEYVMPGRK